MAQSLEQTGSTPILSVTDLDLHYGAAHALKGVNLDMIRHQVTALSDRRDAANPLCCAASTG